MTPLDNMLVRVGESLAAKVGHSVRTPSLFRAWELEDYESGGQLILLIGVMRKDAEPLLLKISLGTDDLDALGAMEDAIVEAAYSEYRGGIDTHAVT